jgi:spore maturation protein CgeB
MTMKIQFNVPTKLRFVFFYHSVISDWNHGNAHFLRGIARDLIARGHEVRIYEPHNGWSLRNLISNHGKRPVNLFYRHLPELRPTFYTADSLDLNKALDGADVVLVHEWNDAALIKRIGDHREQNRSYRLFFHDTHHRVISDTDGMSRYDLSNYDGVLAFGTVLRDLYLKCGWAERAWTWHEAADVRTFFPMAAKGAKRDLIWIGNWGDDERAQELQQFLIDPVQDLGLKGDIYGVRYPHEIIQSLKESGIRYRGWIPNYLVPKVFSKFRLTVHIPRRPYLRILPGIPTIRPFEAMACGIPLICAQFRDIENLFRPGTDFLVAKTPMQMKSYMKLLLQDAAAANEQVENARQTILMRHTCAHRVDELLQIYQSVGQALHKTAVGV